MLSDRCIPPARSQVAQLELLSIAASLLTASCFAKPSVWGVSRRTHGAVIQVLY